MATASQPVEGRSDALRIVLFGMPQAGKSSLLGALAQAAQTQDSVLAGQLVDQSKGLEVLRRRLYEGKAQETLEEVAPYPVTFESFTGSRETASVAEAVLYDCNGHVANELLSRRQTLGDDSGDGALAKAILNADALILVVDASADAGTLRRTFGQFSNFLRLLEQRLGQRAEVGGLPVYLVLSKCDLLAQPGDTSSAWIDRIEDRKREVHDQFQEFLSEEAAREQRPFGRTDLHVWATAVKRPFVSKNQDPRIKIQEASNQARSSEDEPFGVAELFRQSLDAASRFRAERGASNRRLTVTLFGMLGVVAAMLLLGAGLFLMQPSAESSALEDEVRRMRTQLADQPAERLKEPLDERLAQLKKFEDHNDFVRLPPDFQDFVVKTRKELTAYQALLKQMEITQATLTDLNFSRSESDLTRMRQSLEKIEVPKEYLTDWSRMRPVRERDRWLKEIAALEAEASRTRQAYRMLLDEGRKVQALKDKLLIPQLAARAREVLEQARKLPDPVPNGNDLIPGSDEVTYAAVFRLPGVREAYRQWAESETKRQLEAFVTADKGP